MAKLGVNIDHIATVREARKTNEPDPLYAAVLAELGGADAIVAHLREDRRHIQPRDVRMLRDMIKTKLNLEMSVADVVVDAARKIKPDMATIVPERREEVTTEGGLNLKENFEIVKTTAQLLMKEGIRVSLFIDPDIETLRLARKACVDTVELHTGAYANALSEADAMAELKKLADAAEWATGNAMQVNMGHGLTYKNIVPVLAIPRIAEFNIGHSIISRALYVGMKGAVREMVETIHLHGVD